MILLYTLQLKNFISHENTTLNFRDNEKILLDGKSGSGKSSITEAIVWLLYGKGRSDNKSLVRKGTKGASVSIKFADGERETIISRSVTKDGKNTLTVTQNTGAEGQFLPIMRAGIKDTQAWIEEEFLKASYELFTNSVAYPQENENSFVKASASRRKDLLLEIIQAGNFDSLYEKAKKSLTANELECAVSVSNIENLEKTIKKAEETSEKYDFYKLESDAISLQVSTLVKVEKDLESMLSSISTLANQIKDKKTIKQMFVNSLKQLEDRSREDERITKEYKEIDIQTALKNVQEADLLMVEEDNINKELKEGVLTQQKINAHLSNKPNVHDYSLEIEKINQMLIPLIKDTGKCPAGDACPFIIPIKGQMDFLIQQITEKADKSVAEQEAMDEWNRVYTTMIPAKDMSVLYHQLELVQKQIKELRASEEVVKRYEIFEKAIGEMQLRQEKDRTEGVELTAAILDANKEIEGMERNFAGFDSNKVNSELSSLRVQIRGLNDKREEASMKMNLALMAKEDIIKATRELLALKKGIEEALVEKESLELLKEALSPRGIKAVVIDYLVPQLEDRINGVLSQMSDFRIRLDTQKEKADDEGMKEGLFITVINDLQEELAFTNYSGGEKVKITVAISEALASLMSHVGFRIMDENIVSLDKESTEGFIDVIEKLQEKFNQLIVISHLEEVKDIFEKQILITKVNGISKIYG